MRCDLHRLIVFVAAVICCTILYSPPASAERPPQPRSEAAFVVKGTVTDIKTTKQGFFDYYLISLKVSEVVKGDIKPGETLPVVTFALVRKPPGGWVGPGGHGAPPPKGATVVAYVTDRKEYGGYAGIYKDWFDLAPKGKRALHLIDCKGTIPKTGSRFSGSCPGVVLYDTTMVSLFAARVIPV